MLRRSNVIDNVKNQVNLLQDEAKTGVYVRGDLPARFGLERVRHTEKRSTAGADRADRHHRGRDRDCPAISYPYTLANLSRHPHTQPDCYTKLS